MAKQHDKIIDAAISDLEGHKAKLEEVANQLEETIDGRSDKWRESEAGEQATAQLDNLRSAIDSLETAMNDLDTAKGE